MFVVDATPVKSMFATIAPVMLLETIQLYENGPVPPSAVAVQLTVLPDSTALVEGHVDNVTVGGRTVMGGVVP